MGKKIMVVFLVFIICGCLKTDCKIMAKTNRCKQNHFQYSYEVNSNSTITITEIKPLKGDVSVLRIPNTINGKKVVKIGSKYDKEDDSDCSNMFGVYRCEDDWSLQPGKRLDRVSNVRKIILPSSLKEITPNCFNYIQNGKTLLISGNTIQNVKQICDIKWKKVIISSANKKYKVKKKFLVSKNGKTLYGYLGKKKEIIIPPGVQKIAPKAFYVRNKEAVINNMIIDIPKTVTKIGDEAFAVGSVDITFKVNAKNKHYGTDNNCIYSKKSGRLVAAAAKDGVINVPEAVTCLKSGTSISWGNSTAIREIIFPEALSEIGPYWTIGFLNRIKIIFKGKTPPVLTDYDSRLPDSDVYVPRGTKAIYEKKFNPLIAKGIIRIYEK